MIKSGVTFVTSYIKIYDEDYDISRNFENRLKHFMKLVKTGIKICVFLSPEFEEKFREIETEYNNVKIMELVNSNELPYSDKYFKDINDLCGMPINRNELKDTKKYMWLMNSKINFVEKCVKLNPFFTDCFCWFDFSLPYIFKNIDETINKFIEISNRCYKGKFLMIPGCWHKLNNVNYVKNNIYWRFCGGFFIGDSESITEFYDLSNENYAEFLNETKTILWEVNYWAWLEFCKNFNPTWFLADHNDSIVNIPENL